MANTVHDPREIPFVNQVERGAQLAAMLSAVLIALYIVIRHGGKDLTIPLVGAVSVASYSLGVSLLLALILTPLAYLLAGRNRNEIVPARYVHDYRWSVAPVTIAVTILVGLVVMAGFEFASRTYTAIELDLVSALTIVSVLAGVLSYVLVSGVANLAPVSTVYLAIAFLLITLFFPGIVQHNPYWWQKSFSYLGMTESNTASTWIFNFGMIFTGLLLILWQIFFMHRFDYLREAGKVTARSEQIIRTAIIAGAIGMAMVGVVRFGIGPILSIIHDIAATGAGVIFGLLMLGIYRLVPHYMPSFYATSVLMVVLIVISAILKVLGYFNLVGLELAAFIMLGLWVLLFHRNTHLLVSDVMSKN